MLHNKSLNTWGNYSNNDVKNKKSSLYLMLRFCVARKSDAIVLANIAKQEKVSKLLF